MSSSRPRNEDHDRALRLAKRYLRFGTRSRRELRAYLEARGIPAPSREAALAACIRRGWVDDAACTKVLATVLAERGYAGTAIRQQLLAKGLDAGLIDRVLQPIQSRVDDECRARQFIQDRLRGQPSASPRAQARMARLLARRGFDQDLIERLIRRTAE